MDVPAQQYHINACLDAKSGRAAPKGLQTAEGPSLAIRHSALSRWLDELGLGCHCERFEAVKHLALYVFLRGEVLMQRLCEA